MTGISLTPWYIHAGHRTYAARYRPCSSRLSMTRARSEYAQRPRRRRREPGAAGPTSGGLSGVPCMYILWCHRNNSLSAACSASAFTALAHGRHALRPLRLGLAAAKWQRLHDAGPGKCGASGRLCSAAPCSEELCMLLQQAQASFVPCCVHRAQQYQLCMAMYRV